MKEGLKIATIGGGSSYSPELIEGFINRYHELPVKQLWLVDVEEGLEKLNIIGDLARRMVKKAGIDMEIFTTLNRKEALQDADFVTTQFRVGFLDAREKDELIPCKYGVLGQETNGPGGMFKGMRTIPVLLDIVKDCEECCPNAWIISFTNPAGLNAEAVLRYTGWKRFIGLCNSPLGVMRKIATMMDVDYRDLRMDFIGLNHLVFGTKTYVNDVDISDQVIQKLCEVNANENNRIESIPYSPELIKALNVIPGPYLRYYYTGRTMLSKALKAAEGGESRAQVVKKIEQELFKKYADPNLDVKPKELEQRGGAYYSEAACNLISSIYNDKQDIQIVNTLNGTATTSLNPDEVIEVSCVITKDGPKPLSFGRLPIEIEGIVKQIKAYELLSAKAAVSGNRDTLLLALTVNPLVQDEKTAQAIIAEMLEAHKKYLPQFFK